MSDDTGQQRTLGGKPVEVEDENEEPEVNDFGEERPYWETMGGYRRDLINSLMQKAIRRSDAEVAQWAAWEMVRSGFGSNAWNRLTLYLIEDLAAGQEVAIKVPQLERVARGAGMESRVGQVAAIKAARLCAKAWSSRESVHLDDYLRHVAKLRVEQDDPNYEFPVKPTELDYELDDRSAESTGGQMMFVDDGALEPNAPTNDYGDALRDAETHGGYHYKGVLDLLAEAVAEEDIERAGFCAWELSRSGYHAEYWDRIAELCVRHAVADSLAPILINLYETLATERWNPTEWEGRICAIHAAITVIRGERSTASVDVREEYAERAEQRVEGEAQFPVEIDELTVGGRYDVAVDKHTRPGAAAGRDWKHFWFRGARVGPTGEPAHSREWQRRRLELTNDYFREKFTHATEAEIERALEPVTETDRWEEDRIAPDADLDTFGR